MNCACNQPEYVEPEIKVNNTCGCLELPECACREFHHHHHEHSEVETVAPEQAPNHVAPELVHKIQHPCDPTKNPCAPQPEYTQPEIKPECPCANQANTECACNNLKPNF